MLGRLRKRAPWAQREPEGHVDQLVDGVVEGWAWNPTRPNERVSVTLQVDGADPISAVADIYRPDVLAAGCGDGKHGFRLCLPPSHALLGEQQGWVQVDGSKGCLPFQGQRRFAVPAPPLITFLAADIVNNCNLRCPFCVVDYSEVKKTEIMRPATFQRLLELLPLLPQAGFWLSCLHEPTIHPGFEELLHLIPTGQGGKFWFTTNLARRMDDSMFHSWADAGLHHVNVSIDTLDADLFKVLRKHGRLEVFLDNLHRMVTIFRSRADAPKIRFITLVFESNFEELDMIVRRCYGEWSSSEHEIRYMYNMSHVTDEFRRVHLPAHDRWPELKERLSRLAAPHVVISPPEAGYEEERVRPQNYFEIGGYDAPQEEPNFTLPVRLRARHNGNIYLVDQEGRFSLDIATLDDPAAYLLRAVQEAMATPRS